MLVKGERVGDSGFWFDVDASGQVGLLRFGREFGFHFDIASGAWFGQAIDCGEMFELDADETVHLVAELKLDGVIAWFGCHPEAKFYKRA